MPAAQINLEELDVVTLLYLTTTMLVDEAARAVNAAGFTDLRPSHGRAFQHLQRGPMRVGELAEHLGVTQQAASKTLAELASAGYVAMASDAGDARARSATLTQRGWDAIAASRTARAATTERLSGSFGPRRLATTSGLLRDILAEHPELDEVLSRRARLPQL